jgi:hypothetical protein
MQRFALIVVLAALIGGFAALGAVSALGGEETLKIGDVTIPVGVRSELYGKSELRVAVAIAASLAAVAALGLAEAIGRGRRRR